MGPRLSLLLVALSATSGAAPPLDTPASAEACGRCHRAIHEAWKSSAHAVAVESDVFGDRVIGQKTRGDHEA